jgi:hypothetical protein
MTEPKQFIFNDRGEKIAVIIAIDDYEKILEELEDAEDIRTYREVRASGEIGIPLEEVLAEIHRNRK